MVVVVEEEVQGMKYQVEVDMEDTVVEDSGCCCCCSNFGGTKTQTQSHNSSCSGCSHVVGVLQWGFDPTMMPEEEKACKRPFPIHSSLKAPS